MSGLVTAPVGERCHWSSAGVAVAGQQGASLLAIGALAAAFARQRTGRGLAVRETRLAR
jgi:crotonobetainyl-CoA:carnitine CoA-transferase CaiB-like acyl-CoA transferase